MSFGTYLLSAVVAIVLLFGQATQALAEKGPVTGLKPAAPQPPAGALAPGLAATYFDVAMDHVRKVREWAKYKDGRKGAPLARLDYAEGAGEVLTSGKTDEVGAWIKGFVHLDQVGLYRFLVTANDGVQVELGGKRIYRDAMIHKTRTSEPLAVEIATPGWYALEVLYFEARNTAALEIKWQPPGAAGFAYVPASAFAHQK